MLKTAYSRPQNKHTPDIFLKIDKSTLWKSLTYPHEINVFDFIKLSNEAKSNLNFEKKPFKLSTPSDENVPHGQNSKS